MRHEDAGLALWLAGEGSTSRLPRPCQDAESSAALVRVTLRHRAGVAMIALGEWLAGESPRKAARAGRTRRLVGQAS